MLSLIDTVTGFHAAGFAPSRRSHIVESGPYAGRKIVLLNKASDTIAFSVSDPPYTNWSTPTVIDDHAADYPCSGCIDSAGNVYLLYTENTTLALLFRKLTFNAGEWRVGDTVAVYDENENYYPSIARDLSGRLHAVFCSRDVVSGEYSLRYKRSTGDGALWGSGSSDSGTTLVTGESPCYGQLVYTPARLFCLYSDGATKLAVRRLPDGAALWESEAVLYNGVVAGDRLAATAGSSGALLGVAFETVEALHYLEYDHTFWSGLYTVAANPATPPLLLFNGEQAVIVYGVTEGAEQVALKYRRKLGNGFTDEEYLAAELSPFKAVLLYDADGSPQYLNRTAAAADPTTGDVYHSSSGGLLRDVGDALYLGADARFASVSVHLSTVGSGDGTVKWAYFNGNTWQEFVPQSGSYHFDTSSALVRLWSDTASVPADWQKNAIQQLPAYWIRIEVDAAYSTAPVGSQLTPLVLITQLND